MKNLRYFAILGIFVFLALSTPSSQVHCLPAIMQNPLDKIRNFIGGQFNSINEFLKNTTTGFWNELSPKLFSSFSSDDLTFLCNDNQGKIPERSKKELCRLRINSNYTVQQIQNLLNPGNVGRGEIQQVIRILPPPESFSKENVTNLSDRILKLGDSFILRISNPEANAELKTIIDRNYNSGNQKTRDRMSFLKKQLFRKANGPPSTWTNETIKDFDFRVLTNDLAMKIKPETLISRKSNLISSIYSSSNQMLRRTVVKKILEAEEFFEEKDPAKAYAILNGLGNLKKDVLPEDLKFKAVREYQQTKTLIDDNVKKAMNNGDLLPKSAKRLAKEMAMIPNITKQILDTKGYKMLAFSSPKDFKRAWKEGGAITEDNIPGIATAMKNRNGPGAESNLRLMAQIVSEYFKTTSSPSLKKYPSEVVAKIHPKDYSKISENDAKQILSKTGSEMFDEIRTATLLNKIPSSGGNYQNLNVKARSMIPFKNIKDFSVFDLVKIVKDLPPITPANKHLVAKAFDGITVIDEGQINIQQEEVLQSMGIKEANMFKNDTIAKTLARLKAKNVNPTYSACNVLKNIYLNYSQNELNSNGAADAMARMTISDIELIPVCVIGAFGARNLFELGDDQKVFLMELLGKIQNAETSITREARMAIVGNGLDALRGSGSLRPGDLELVGDSVFDIPSDILSGANEETVSTLIMKMTDVLKRKMVEPCLDQDQRNAIGESVLILKGDPRMWDNIDDVVCLLRYVRGSNLEMVPEEVISASKCKKISIPIFEEYMESLCKASLGEYYYEMMEEEYEDLEEIQEKATFEDLEDIEEDETDEEEDSKRRKRDADSEMTKCSRVAIGGANALKNDEIEKMTFAEVYDCLQELGAMDMEQYKSELLIRVIREGFDNDIANINASTIEMMGFILKGASDADLTKFPDFKYGDFDRVVSSLGMNNIFNTDQLSVINRNVRLNWRNPSDATAENIIAINYLLCGYRSQDISSFKASAMKTAIPIIKKVVEECDNNKTTQSFAALAKHKDAYSDVTTWTKAIMAELGVIVAGLSAEELTKLVPDAMEGLSPSAIEAMDLDAIKALNKEHFMNMNPAAAQAISSTQEAVLMPEMIAAIGNVLGAFEDFDAPKSTTLRSASDSLLLVILTAVLVVISGARNS